MYFNGESCRGYVVNSSEIEELEDKWFGARQNNKLVLDIVEVAYLLLNSKARVSGRVEAADLDSFLNSYHECLEHFFWPKLIVYRDLRDRGRRVKVLGETKFLVKDKHGDLRLVVVLEEGSRRSALETIKDVELARNNNLKVVYAIVSLQGDLTYYELNRIDPRRE